MVFQDIGYILQGLVDPVLHFLVVWPPVLAMLLLTFVITLIITVIYKYTTNQTLLKELRGELQKGRDKMKAAKGNPQKQLEIQKQLAGTQHKFMMQSFRSMIFTFLPIIILLGWMQVNFAVDPLDAGEPIDIVAKFSKGAIGQAELVGVGDIGVDEMSADIVDRKATWSIDAPATDGSVLVSYGEEEVKVDIVVDSRTVAKRTFTGEEAIRTVDVAYEKLPIINLFGWELGWFWSYFIFSIVFSVSLRKLLRVY